MPSNLVNCPPYSRLSFSCIYPTTRACKLKEMEKQEHHKDIVIFVSCLVVLRTQVTPSYVVLRGKIVGADRSTASIRVELRSYPLLF